MAALSRSSCLPGAFVLPHTATLLSKRVALCHPRQSVRFLLIPHPLPLLSLTDVEHSRMSFIWGLSDETWGLLCPIFFFSVTVVKLFLGR